ncbi:hypothetical protein Poli38472_013089 [Pythium oligandrum]|uniref:Uncharacterized protein n=1 Tax=Pythium oligandrum TaxID=41045 RepID=A0A8K1FDT6_PYTOL|nr:hypothetical protein Poli38472_013089 [Pythium oligandrum]|eukprot:TMW55198.1 hypothetical protein Poli38472_013089 [Pythium oligandrum]
MSVSPALAARPQGVLHADGVYEWLVRRRREELPVERVLSAIRTAAGSVPLGGTVSSAVRTSSAAALFPVASAALTTTTSDADLFYELLLTCCALPASHSPSQQRDTLRAFLDDTVRLTVPASSDDVKAWWTALAQARDAYFHARRAFFVVRIELLRIAAFQTAATVADPAGRHPQAALVHQVVSRLVQDGLQDALVDELLGRQHVQVPNFYAHLRIDVPHTQQFLRMAQQQWEAQLLDEEMLLRELLLLVLYFTNGRLALSQVKHVTEHILQWPRLVLPDVISQHSLSLPAGNRKLRRIAALGTMLAVRVIHHISQSRLESELTDISNWMRQFLLTETWREQAAETETDVEIPLSEGGCIYLAWATLLAKIFRRQEVGSGDLERDLQAVLAASERVHGFQELSEVLRCLVFDEESDNRFPFLLGSTSVRDEAKWCLPRHNGVPETFIGPVQPPSTDVSLSGYDRHRKDVFQMIGAIFVDDAVASLGYADNLREKAQLNAMVKLVLPVLGNSTVVDHVLLHERPVLPSAEFGSALVEIVRASRDLSPDNVLPLARVFAAFCSSETTQYGAAPSARGPVHLALREFAKQHQTTFTEGNGLGAWRQLPPDEYLEYLSQDEVVCKISFTYEGDRVSVPVGTRGFLDAEDPSYVQWRLAPQVQFRSAWDSIFSALETMAEQMQHQPLFTIQTEEIEVLTAFFEWVVQVSKVDSVSSSLMMEIFEEWGQARLRQWWREMELPGGDDIPALLCRAKISLTELHAASNEDLVAWGISDRYIRKQIMGRIAAPSASATVAANQRRAKRKDALERDGLVHMMRMLLGFLDGFLHAMPHSSDDDAEMLEWTSKQIHLITSILVLFQSLASVDLAVDVLVQELSGTSEECINLLLKSTRKLFEYHESDAGDYPGTFATLSTLMSVTRWLLSKEAVFVAHIAEGSIGALSRDEFVLAERHWLVGTVEFVLEIISTHDTWRFTDVSDKWVLINRCFRVLTTLITPNFHDQKHNSMLQEFQTALRSTLISDLPLTMKILRSCCRVLRKEGFKGAGESALGMLLSEVASTASPLDRSSNGANTNEEPRGLFPLAFEEEVFGASELISRESLVVTSLRLMVSLFADSSLAASTSANSALLLQTIDGDGITNGHDLNLVLLCAGYLAYPVSKNGDIATWSLKILQHAALAFQIDPQVVDGVQNRSLVALFPEKSDLVSFRDALLSLLRSYESAKTGSANEASAHKELLTFLTLCLECQPGLFAFILLEARDEASGTTSSNDSTKQLVSLIERFLSASEELLEHNADLLCSVLLFLREVWRGSVKDRRRLHLQIAQALRYSTTFWQKLTRALRVRMPLRLDDDDDATDMETDDAFAAPTVAPSNGRSGVYGYLARGLILEILSFEWHSKCSRSDEEHPLVNLLDSFRAEGLYAHWLRTFSRLDFSASRFAQLGGSVEGFFTPLPAAVVQATEAPSVVAYHEQTVDQVRRLEWQLAPLLTTKANRFVLNRAHWGFVQTSFVAAQLYSFARWKVFMELYSLQGGSASDGQETSVTSAAPGTRAKRKESMIASPPRMSTRYAPTSPLHSAASTSNFSGDRTSYGLIQVLSDVILAQRDQQQREGDGGLDYFALSHLKHLVEVLVSMLHHQLCVVLRKTRDPKLSQIQQREQAAAATTRLTLTKSLELLGLMELTSRQVLESIDKMQAVEVDSKMSLFKKTVPRSSLWQRLVPSFEVELNSMALQLRTTIQTAALLLSRHISTQYHIQQRSLPLEFAHQAAILQVKFVEHAIESIKLCHRSALQSESLGAATVSKTESLFQVSWCLLQELLDDFSAVAMNTKDKLQTDPIVALRPLIVLLQNEQNGVRALLEIVRDCFRRPSCASESQKQALTVLEGLTAIVWNQRNAELCRQVMLLSSNVQTKSVLRFIAVELIPVLQSLMDGEESVEGVARGYRSAHGSDNESGMERSTAHRAWCGVVRIAAGIIKHLPARASSNDVWEFLASTETLLASALKSTPRLTRALVEEQHSVLQLLNSISAVPERRKQWREMFPKQHVVLMEQSRLMLRRGCVLLGNSSFTAARKREQQLQLLSQKKQRRLSVTAWPLSTSPRASHTYAHQTLLHENLMAVEAKERRHLMTYYSDMEIELIDVVSQASSLLLHWTTGIASRAATVSVGGSRFIDNEQLIPLLAFVSPADSITMSCEPSLGQLCVAMEFFVDQLKREASSEENESAKTKTAANVRARAVGALHSCGLLFLKNLLIHVDQSEDLGADDMGEFQTFFETLNDQLGSVSRNGTNPDVAFFQQIQEVVQRAKSIGGSN